MSFARTVAIDWSGAKGTRHKGIAIAEARPGQPPRLVRPGHVWSRCEVLGWLLKRAAEEPTLFGFDFSFAPPLVERGEYLIGEPGVPKTAREFWGYVDAHCDDEDLGAARQLSGLRVPLSEEALIERRAWCETELEWFGDISSQARNYLRIAGQQSSV